MQFRLNFDDNISAGLIEKIIKRASGGSLNKALQTMVIEWSALEGARSTSKIGQKTDAIHQDQTNSEAELLMALDDLDAAFGE